METNTPLQQILQKNKGELIIEESVILSEYGTCTPSDDDSCGGGLGMSIFIQIWV